MANEPQKPVYRRLGGRGLSGCLPTLRGTTTLWLADDHLLQATRFWLSERYRRFYFRDIQAVIVRRTARATAVSLAAIGGALVLLATGAVFGGDVLVGFGFSAAVLGAVALVNAALGQSCVTRVQTAVQTESLGALTRMRGARRAIAQLRPLIEREQADIVRVHTADEIQSVRPEPVPVHGQTGTAAAGPRKRYSGRWHVFLFAGFLADSSVSAGLIFANQVVLWLAGALLTVALTGLAIVALVRQHAAPGGAGVKVVTWLALVYLGASMIAGQVLNVFVSITNPEVSQNQWLLLKALAELDVNGSLWLLVLLSVFAALSFAVGCVGLLMTAAAWRRARSS